MSDAGSTEPPGRRTLTEPERKMPEATFEELSRELEEIVARLERGEVAVDEAVALFRRGEELHRACVERLEAAQLRLEELSAADGDERA